MADTKDTPQVAYWRLLIQSREELIAHVQRQVDHLKARIAEAESDA
jgi:hypothetical protein